MATCFEKYAKYLAKQRKINIQRDGDIVYVCDGYSMVKLPAVSYDYEMRTISPVFPEIEDGERARYDKMAQKPFPEIVPDGIDLKSIWDKSLEKSIIPATVTPFIIDLEKGLKARFITADGKYIEINENFYAWVAGYSWKASSTGNNTEPVFFLTDGKMGEPVGFMILPMRLATEKLNDFLHPQAEAV